jgi:hypothetical protein
MNNQIFISLIESFNRGEIQFNLGTNWSFLFNNHWYPTRAFMSAYNQELGQNADINLYQAVFELSKFMPIISADIKYNDNLPVSNII